MRCSKMRITPYFWIYIMMRLSFYISLIFLISSCDLKHGLHKIESPVITESIDERVIAIIDSELEESPLNGNLLKRKVRYLQSAGWPSGSADVINKAVEVLNEDGELHFMKAGYLLNNEQFEPGIEAP